jgi:hypothetical protein
MTDFDHIRLLITVKPQQVVTRPLPSTSNAALTAPALAGAEVLAQ